MAAEVPPGKEREMAHRRWQLAIAAILIGGLTPSCGGGGSGSSGSPFPPAVGLLFNPLSNALRTGVAFLPGWITCTPVTNPFPEIQTGGNPPVQIAGSAFPHAGTVAFAREEILEQRNPSGSGTMSYRVWDSADPLRVFVDRLDTFGPPIIQYLPPPIGATQFLAPDGTGQSFVVLTIQRRRNWTRDFDNDPLGVGTGTLVNFAGPPSLVFQPNGSITGATTEKLTFLIEFDILQGPPTNQACIASIDQIGSAETSTRSQPSPGPSVTAITHDHLAFADTLIGPQNALWNGIVRVIPVGPDALSNNPVADGDAGHLSGGSILGGISGIAAAGNDSRVNDGQGTFVLVSDGVAPVTDGDFDGVSSYDIDGTLDIAGGPGGVNNGVVEFSFLTVRTKQLELPQFDDLDHPVPDLDEISLWGSIAADTETGIIIFR